MLDMVDIGEISRHQALWTVERCGCGALGANRVCRFVVAGENGVRVCEKIVVANTCCALDGAQNYPAFGLR